MGTRTPRVNAPFAAAAAALSGTVFAQPELAPNSEQLLQQIAQLRVEGGPTPAGLVNPLRALALLYEEDGDYVFAISALEEARFVTRVHQGLSSADEALLLRQQIRSEKALGDHRRVWDLEQEMVTIARQHHDDIRMMPVFRDLAEDRADALEEYSRGTAFPPEIELGCYYVPGPRRYDDTRAEVRPPNNAGFGNAEQSCQYGERSTVIAAIRSESLMHYADAIEVIVRNGDYASPELRDLETQALRVAPFLAGFAPPLCNGTMADQIALPIVGSCLEPVLQLGETVVPNIGWASLVRSIAYEIRAGAPAAVRAKAIADFADWHLLVMPPERRRFSEISDTAFEIYERAYRLQQQDDDALAMSEIFSPELPITLPMYQPNPFVSTAEAEPARYIDVAFNVTKYGRGERIEILDTSKNATRAERRDLIHLIETTSFRPRFVDGDLADSAPVVVRYALGP